MAETDHNNIIGLSGFSDADLLLISQIKDNLNDIIEDDGFYELTVNDNPYDKSFISAIQNYILNDAATSDNPELQALKDQYMSLSDEGRERIESYNSYFLNKDASNDDKARQAQKIIQKAQENLGGSHTNTDPTYSPENEFYFAEVDNVTTYALSKYLEKMKVENPELVDEDFEPSKLDGKALDFMNRLVAKRMDEASAKPDDLNSTLIHLWILQEDSDKQPLLSEEDKELSKAASIRDLLGLVATGELPNGSDVRIRIDDSFTGPVYTSELTDDRFFSGATYTAIMNKHEVPASVLFADDCDNNPHVEDLKLAAKALGIDTENGVVSQEQVGQIAARMLEYQACKLGIEKHEITAAINNLEFMPDLDDLRLVELGLGLPPDLQEHNQSGADAYMAEFEYRDKVLNFRNARWEKEFGAMTEKELERRINIFHGGQTGNPQVEKFVRGVFTLPSQNYGSPRVITGSTNPTYYEAHRGNYLRENMDKLKPCVSEVTHDVSTPKKTPEGTGSKSEQQSAFSTAASEPTTPKYKISAAIQDATGEKPKGVPEDATTPTPTDQNESLAAVP